MIAVKGNRTYQIDSKEAEWRKREGYDIYDDNGNLIAYSDQKTVPYAKYENLLKENKKLTARLSVLENIDKTESAEAEEKPKKQTAKKA